MAVSARAGQALVIVFSVALVPAALAVSCAPNLRVIPGTGGSPATTSSTGGSVPDGGGGSGGGTLATGGSDAGTGGAFDAGTGGGPSDAGSDASDASDAAGDAADASCGSDIDPHNCGRCGHDCCGGACSGGICQQFIISQGTNPGVPAVDQSFIYWPDAQGTTDGGILKAPKTGGAPVALTPGQNGPYAVAVDSTSVYWVTYSNNPPNYGGVFKVPVGGGAVVPLVPTGEDWANSIVVNGSTVFWADFASSQIRSVGVNGGTVTTLAQATDGVASPLQMAADGQSVYWTDRFSGGAIQKAAHFSTGAVTISNGQDPVAVAVDAVNVYWANYSTGTIQKAPLGGGTASLVATSGGNGAWTIATDGSNVYWGNKGAPGDGGAPGSIRAAPVSGDGGIGTVLAQSPNPLYVTIDASCVYWADNKNGNIGVVAKP